MFENRCSVYCNSFLIIWTFRVKRLCKHQTFYFEMSNNSRESQFYSFLLKNPCSWGSMMGLILLGVVKFLKRSFSAYSSYLNAYSFKNLRINLAESCWPKEIIIHSCDIISVSICHIGAEKVFRTKFWHMIYDSILNMKVFLSSSQC